MSESAEGLAAGLAEEEEGFSSLPYCGEDGVWTYGYGSTRDPAGKPVTKNTPPISKADADKLVKRDMMAAFDFIRGDVKVPLNEDETAAFADFIYNVGAGNFAKSTLLRKLNAGDYEGAAQELDKWDLVHGHVLAGLVRRRAEERTLVEEGIAESSSGTQMAAAERPFDAIDAAFGRASADLQSAKPAPGVA